MWGNSYTLFDSSRNLRSKVKNLLDTVKNRFLERKIKNANASKALWKILKNIGLVAGNYQSPLNYLAGACRKHHSISQHNLDSILRVPIDYSEPVLGFH